MNSRTIKSMLLLQGVESNPGPKSNLAIRTYNCNGLGNTDKCRRILIKVRKEVDHGGIVLLQETHIKNEKIIKTYWKGSYVTSCISTNH